VLTALSHTFPEYLHVAGLRGGKGDKEGEGLGKEGTGKGTEGREWGREREGKEGRERERGRGKGREGPDQVSREMTPMQEGPQQVTHLDLSPVRSATPFILCSHPYSQTSRWGT